MQRQPTGSQNIFRALFIGLALIESGIVIAFIMSLILMFGNTGQVPTSGRALAELGIALAIGFSAAAVSIASCFVVKAATESIARQPRFAQKIITMMLLTQSIIEAPVIFAFIVSLMIFFSIHSGMTSAQGLQSFAAGLAIAFGSIGPSIGLALFSHATCIAIGLNTKSYNKIFPFALLNEAVIETPIIFSLLISMMILYSPLAPTAMHNAYILLAAALSVGISAIGTSSGIGYAAAKSALQIGLDPERNYAAVFRTTLLVATFIETSVIYGTIIALLLVMKAT